MTYSDKMIRFTNSSARFPYDRQYNKFNPTMRYDYR